MNQKVTIYGAGFSGLTSAYYFLKSGYAIEVVESLERAGGLIETTKTQWGLAESAANGLIVSDKVLEVFKDIGLEFLKPSAHSKKRYIFRDGPGRWPMGLFETAKLAFHFLKCKNRKPHLGESIHVWGNRVLGAMPTKYLLEPALQGIYAGDPQRLSASLILSRFFNKKAGKKSGKFVIAPKEGMGALTHSLKNYLEKNGVKFRFQENCTEVVKNDHLQILCVPAYVARQMLSGHGSGISGVLSEIEYVPLVSATLFYPKYTTPLEGFGCLFPRDQKIRALGVLFNDQIFERESDFHSETWIMGGVGDPQVISYSDNEVIDAIDKDRAQLSFGKVKSSGYKMTRWPLAIPHYTLDLEKILNSNFQKNINDDGIYLFGNYLGSLGLSQIIEAASNFTLLVQNGK